MDAAIRRSVRPQIPTSSPIFRARARSHCLLHSFCVRQLRIHRRAERNRSESDPLRADTPEPISDLAQPCVRLGERCCVGIVIFKSKRRVRRTQFRFPVTRRKLGLEFPNAATFVRSSTCSFSFGQVANPYSRATTNSASLSITAARPVRARVMFTESCDRLLAAGAKFPKGILCLMLQSNNTCFEGRNFFMHEHPFVAPGVRHCKLKESSYLVAD